MKNNKFLNIKLLSFLLVLVSFSVKSQNTLYVFNDSPVTKELQTSNEDFSFIEVDKNPELADDELKDIKEYIYRHVDYNKAGTDSLERKIGGIILYVDKEGKIQYFTRNLSEQNNQEIDRVMQSIAKVNPAMKDGVQVGSLLFFPIPFNNLYKKNATKEDFTPNTILDINDVDSRYISLSIPPEIMILPQFPVGGEAAMNNFIASNLKYPKKAQKKGIQGRVVVRFVVSKTGEIKDVTVLKGIDPECDAESVRVVEKMPNWIPGSMDGVPVPIYFTIPLNFRLSRGKTNDAGN